MGDEIGYWYCRKVGDGKGLDTVPAASRCVALASGAAVTTPRSEDAAGTVFVGIDQLLIPNLRQYPDVTEKEEVEDDARSYH